jgi:transcriptional antiterminator
MQQITKRQIQVLLQLLEDSQPVTTKELAAQQNVSVRTIKYDWTRFVCG